MNSCRAIALAGTIALLGSLPSRVMAQQMCPDGCQCIGKVRVCPMTKPDFTAEAVKSLKKALQRVQIK
jgi:hypothetical protein